MTGLAGILLVLAMLLTACPEGEVIDPDNQDPTIDPGPIVTVSLPVFTHHPTSANYTAGGTPAALKVGATVSQGVLSYQWYEAVSFISQGGNVIEDAVQDSFTPDISAVGTKYYYAVVTNTFEGKTRFARSNPAQIAVLASLPATPQKYINVTATQAQYVRGFGGMSNAFGIGSPARYMEMSDIETMFNPETGLGFNILRVCIWPNPLDEILRGWHYPEMGNQIYAEIVKRVNRYGGYVLASPWTPPAEYKTNASELGNGHLRADMFANYARYLRTFAEEMAAKGAPVYAVAVQNEPTHEASYHGMLWSQAEHLSFMKDYAQNFHTPSVPGYGGGSAQPRVLLMGGEPHNDLTWNNSVMNDSAARANLDIVAYHTYGSLNSRYAPVRVVPQKEVWMTEKNHNSGEGNYHLDSTWNYVWHVANEIQHSLVNVDANGFIWWYAKRFYSFIGDGSNQTANNSVLPRGYVASHYAKYATDTVRLETQDNLPPDFTGSDTLRGREFSVAAFVRKSEPNPADYDEQKLKSRENAVSLVIYDRRTGATGESTPIRINLPAGFVATNAFGIISDGIAYHAPLVVVLGPDGTYGDVTLPSNSIISVKFVK